MRRLSPVLVLLFVACASGSIVGTTGSTKDASTEDFDVTIEQSSTPEVFRGDNSAEVQFEITIVNRTAEPYRVSRISLQSLGSSEYHVALNSRKFDKTIAPGGRETFSFWSTTYVRNQNAKEPLTLRATIEATSASGVKREEVFSQRVNGRVQISADAAGGAAWSPPPPPARV